MLDKKTIENRRGEFAEELHAGSVFRDIQAREKEREDYEKRWFWELLQNAKDSTNVDGKVDVKIEINENYVAFSHSGNPFKLDEILSLIIQGSSKIDDDTKTGRFGTGFMTTYLLSKKVKITGKLTENDGYFDFWLNRDADDIKEFYNLQTKSNDEFINSLKDKSYLGEDECQTKFLYELNPEGRKTSEAGLKSLNELIPFTQLFNSQIDSITVCEELNVVTFQKCFMEKHLIGDSIVEEWELTNSNEPDKLKAYIIKEENFDIVLVSKVLNNIEELIDVGSQYPKLYYTFPLIGTEDLGIPFIINSTSFDPKIERDGIYLNSQENSKEGTERNKNIISNAIGKAVSLFSEVVKKKRIKGVYNLYNFSKANDYKWLDNNWFNEVKNKYVESLINTDCISIENDFHRLSSFHLPYAEDENLTKDIWNLLNDNKSFKPVPNDEIFYWITIFENFAELKDTTIYEIDNVVGSKYLVKYLSQKDNLKNLEYDLDENCFQWLDRLYSLINNDLEDFPLNRKIMLNQENQFVCAEDIRWDEVKDHNLVEISKKLKLDFSKKLISQELKDFEIIGVDDFKIESAIDQIKNKLNQLEPTHFENADFIEGNALFVKWLITNAKLSIIKDIKIVSLENNTENSPFVVQTFPNSKHLLLAPKDYFKEEYPFFAGLIRERDCLHPVYNHFLDKSDFMWLESNGLIFCSPLVRRSEKLDSKTIELLISNPEDLNKLKDEEGKIIYEVEMEYSDFAFLTSSDGHIYDRNSTTTSSLKIFNFLLNEATVTDSFFETKEEDKNVNGEAIKFNKMLWLQRAKNIQWVNVKNLESSNSNKFSKEVPSSKNLSELIKDSPELINTIRGESQISFLSMINVGVSDLIRNTLPSDDIRISWDKALTNMITSNADPELVQEIFSDQSIQEEYKNRLEKKKLIKRNQNIGFLVEKLFKELIKVLKKNGVDIDIERKPFGSDYLLTEASSDLVEDNKEVLFKINDWLIELKATGKEFAAMTSLQVDKAVKYKKNYALVVVPLDGSEPDIDYVRKNARVVSDIGYRLEDLYNNFSSVEKMKDNLMNINEDVSVSIENQNIRFRINSANWASHNSLSTDDFIFTRFNIKKSQVKL